MRRTSRSLVFAAVGWLATSCGAASLPTPAPTPPPQACDGTPTGTADELAAEYAATVHPLLLRSSAEGGCVSCHGPQAAGRFTVRDREPPRVTFEHLVRTGLLASSGPDTLVDRLGRSDTLRMPLGGPTWSAEERASITRLACRVEVSGLTSSCGALDPGTVPLRRLANAEYDRTVASALLAPGRPSERLAADQPTFGFDNVSRDQTFDLGRLERYRDVAEALAEDTLVPPRGVEVTREAEGLAAFTHWGDPVGPGQGSKTSDGWRFARIKSRLSVGLVRAPYAGAYTVEVWARGTSANHYSCQNPMTTPPVNACQQAMVGPPPWGAPWRQVGTAPVPPKLEVSIDGRSTLIDVQASELGPFAKHAVTVDLEAGFHSLDVGLFNVVFWSGEALDVTLEVDQVTWKGPAALPRADTARLQRFLRRCQTYGCGALAVRDVLETLWRRPVTPAEVARYGPLLTDAADAGEPFSEGLSAVLSAALLSPEFLFRPELDPQPEVPQSRPLTGFELATRLSYFLWGGPPDELLLARAGDGSLVTDEGLRAQVERLLADARARALVDRFAWQWLELDKLSQVRPTSSDFDESLRAAFTGELRALLTDAFEQDRPVTELIESPRVFANARLARFY
ncbi:MAG: DUF1592 domain-containing protein, partial [Myxococcaceae bacterium]|nr:DUF1592 domain-containing protein [Myxococcaceae bacterium]